MRTLRFFLGAVAVLVDAGWIVLALIADHFRRSFGAAGVNPLLLAVPPLAATSVLLTVLMPQQRVLLHLAAALLALAAAGLVLLLRDTPFVGGFGLLFLAIWYVYYWRTCWA